MPREHKKNKITKYIFLSLAILLFIYSYKFFDVNWIKAIFIENQYQTGLITILTIFFLRAISIVVPMLPGTYCSVLAGYFYGIQYGLILIFLADFVACSSSFLIARKYGRAFIHNFLGSKQMKVVEKVSHKYLENNFFLMTGLLMTQFFDFVCYAVGLTQVPLKKFFPALTLSILISDLPFVASGFAIKGLKDVSFRELLTGNVKVLQGPYLMIFIISALTILSLGIFSFFLERRNRFS